MSEEKPSIQPAEYTREERFFRAGIGFGARFAPNSIARRGQQDGGVLLVTGHNVWRHKLLK